MVAPSFIYGIPSYYSCNRYEHYDDWSTPDKEEFQKEVYELAKFELYKHNDIRDIPVVVDFGCGSGYKLIKNFGGNSRKFTTIGIDVKDTVDRAVNEWGRLDTRVWLSDLEASLYSCSADLFIAADVIEHLINPISVFTTAKSFGDPLVVISTPARDLYPRYYSSFPWGPPENPCHIREWTYDEFDNWLANFFEYHELQITSYEHCTMTAVGWLKESF